MGAEQLRAVIFGVEAPPERNRRGHVIAGGPSQLDAEPVGLLLRHPDPRRILAEAAKEAGRDLLRLEPIIVLQNVVGKFVGERDGELVLVAGETEQPRCHDDIGASGEGVDLRRAGEADPSGAAGGGAKLDVEFTTVPEHDERDGAEPELLFQQRFASLDGLAPALALRLRRHRRWRWEALAVDGEQHIACRQPRLGGRAAVDHRKNARSAVEAVALDQRPPVAALIFGQVVKEQARQRLKLRAEARRP
jgi:hypothetical protein